MIFRCQWNFADQKEKTRKGEKILRSDTLPVDISQHFVSMGVNIVKVWWPRHTSSIFNKVPHFDGLYKQVKIRFSIPDSDIEPFNYELKIYHPSDLGLGLTLAKLPGGWKTFFSHPVRRSFLARKITLWDKDLRCWAVKRGKAQALLAQDRVKVAIWELLSSIKEYCTSFLIIDDHKSLLKFSGHLPSQSILDRLCEASVSLAECASRVMGTGFRDCKIMHL